jgi:hypothetical protein
VLGNIITTIFKVFIYFILGCIAVGLIIALFAVAITAIGLFPLKNFVLTDGSQSLLAWGTLIFFIGVPVVGIITFIIRRIARVKSSNKLMRYSFVGLWILGIICFVSLLTSVGRDFRSVSTMNTSIVMLSNPKVKNLEVMPIQKNDYYRGNSWFKLEPFATFGMDEDTAFISNIRIRIEKSNTDSFEVRVMKLVNGRTRRYADTLASLINFNVAQSDSVLTMDRAIRINTTDKFRNQFVEVTILVPVGHRIKIDKNFGYRNRVRFSGFWNDNDWFDRNGDDDFDYKTGEDYIMKEDGLYTLNGIPSNKENDWNAEQNDNQNNISRGNDDTQYRYNNSKIDSLKAAQDKQIQKMQASVDSLKAAREKEVDRMKDSLRKAKEEIDQKIQNLNKGTALSGDTPIKSTNEAYSFIMYI